ncbi:AraJ Arabinose efflux permease [Pyrenophora tritici-repentis]|nr:AraJ Arabinose efflux permease [Pyrenophora tritici-repentis]
MYRKEELPSVYSHPDSSVASSATQVVKNFLSENDSNIVNWQGENDAANPRNFPSWKKTINIACIFYLCLVSPFTSSVVAPAIPDIMADFASTDAYLSAFVLSVYVLGYAFGPLLISPLSEQYGRLPLYHAGNVLFTVCTLACGRANSLGMLAVLRFLAGAGASNVFALAPSSLADLVAKEERGRAMALVGMAYNLGPAISPTAGSYLNAAQGWRWVFYLTGILGGAGTLLSMICMSETYEPVILRRKAAHLRKQTGDKTLRAKSDTGPGANKIKAFREAMVMPFAMLFFSRPIFFTSLLTAVGYGYVYILYTTIPSTFLETYHWAPKKLGLAYLGTAVGNLIGMVGASVMSDSLVKRRALKDDTRPEIRLLPMIFWWPLVSVGLFMYAWTAQHAVHWIAPLIGTTIFGMGAMSAIFFTGTYILDAYPLHSASGMAACSVMRSLIGGLAPLFSHKMYQDLGVGWAFSLLALIALAFAPVPVVFYKFGEKWRGQERYGGRVVTITVTACTRVVFVAFIHNAGTRIRSSLLFGLVSLGKAICLADELDGEDYDSETQAILEEFLEGLTEDYTEELIVGIDGRSTEGAAVQDNITGITELGVNDSTPSEANSETTLVDPLPSISSHPPLGYRSASSPSKPDLPPIPGNLALTIGAAHTLQQIYSLPKALLCHHSSYFATFISTSPKTSAIALPQFTPRNFSNYVHYMRSNIYSPAAHTPRYRALGTHVEACLLGAHLGVPAYCEAAIRALHDTLAKSVRPGAGRNARVSRITPQDMEYVCDQADVRRLPDSVRNTDEYVRGLRRLLLDAVAAQCGQGMVLSLEEGLEGEDGGMDEEEYEDEGDEETDWLDFSDKDSNSSTDYSD